MVGDGMCTRVYKPAVPRPRRREPQAARSTFSRMILGWRAGMRRQCDGRALRGPAILLPVPQGVDADHHRLGELDLGEAQEPAKGGDVRAGLEPPANEPLP